MAVEIREIKDREEWLAWRRQFVTASTVGGLPAFNCHPYYTPLRIYAGLSGVEFPIDDDNKVLRRGRWLEPAVAKAVSELRPEWGLAAPNAFYCDPDIGIGATPDYFITGDPRGRGNLQIKTVASSVWTREWSKGQDIPLWVTLQCLTEMLLTDSAFGAVAVMLVDPHNMDVEILDVPRHAAAEAKLVAEVKRFRADVAAGIEPPVDFERDGAVLKLLIPRERPGAVIDLTGDNVIPDLLVRREAMCAEMKRLKKRTEKIENQLRAVMGDAATATGIVDFSISYKVQKRSGYTVAPSEPRVLLIKDKRPPELRPGTDDEDDDNDG